MTGQVGVGNNGPLPKGWGGREGNGRVIIQITLIHHYGTILFT